ncbi:helix-turn-helix transcriptional regulator [uncultured Mucilaginibacter sp.]|uniref:helix-turn-helix domain-containing protein n=1 Tax=uncultured Mucilaginibacter sp. TaxID=797541 RepID=UPI002616081E|nr:helix-turn-helix transcriptional regulator [uncultured Mucilaginibacter sp.]
MNKAESVKDFFASRNPSMRINDQFTIFERKVFTSKTMPYNRRDFYIVTLALGVGKLHFADKSVEINKPALIFMTPVIPYAWEPVSPKQEGFFCLFTEGFFRAKVSDKVLQDSPIFKIGADPVFFINETQQQHIATIFQNMLREFHSDYIYKYELLRNYIILLLHEVIKMQPVINPFKHQNASSRIASLFLELLEHQFPISSPQYSLKLRTATDYAKQLSVHINHLNRAVKKATGKTTTEHLNERIISEAKALLLNSDWSVSEIAYSLGYKYPTYFNNLFKKQTGVNPSSLRQDQLV